MENIIYYFTGTGNSLMAAKRLGEKLNGNTELRALTNYLDMDEIKVDATETVGFVFPIYGGDTPWPVKVAASKMKIPEGVYVFAIGTCNERAAHGVDYFAECTKKYGFTVSYGRPLTMPGNGKYSNDEENAERLETLDMHLDLYAKGINNRMVGTVGGFDFPENTAEGARAKYMGRMPWAVDAESCIGCGICENLCPMANIKLEGGLPQFGTECATCYGCFHLCPQEAIFMAAVGKEKSRPRYCHPEVTWEDIAVQQKRY